MASLSSLTPPPAPASPPGRMSVLVVHADSYTGRYIARMLVLDPTLHIRITARRRESIHDLEDLGCDYYPLRDIPPRPDDLDPIYTGVSVVVLVPPMVNQLDDIVNRHVDAALRASPSPTGNPIHIVFLSYLRANRGYPTADPWAELERAEDIIRQGSPTHSNVILRVGYVQQNLIPLAELIRGRAVLPLPLGPNALVTPVNLKDVASAVRSVIPGGRRANEAQGQTYVLTGPQAVSGDDMARIASAELGFQIAYVNVRDSVMRRILHTLPGIPEAEVEAYMAMYQDIRDGYHNRVSQDLAFLLPRNLITLTQFFHDNASQFRPEINSVHPTDLDQVDPIAAIYRVRRFVASI